MAAGAGELTANNLGLAAQLAGALLAGGLEDVENGIDLLEEGTRRRRHLDRGERTSVFTGAADARSRRAGNRETAVPLGHPGAPFGPGLGELDVGRLDLGQP